MSSNKHLIEDDISTLPTLFQQGLDLFNNLGRTDEPTNSLDVQLNIKKCIKIFEKATILCSYADIFSRNEGIEEIDTKDLQYLLLPALLGSLHLKLTSAERKNIVDVSEVYFTDFMRRCVDYNLCKYEFKKPQSEEHNIEDEESKNPMTEMEELTILARRRAIKIFHYNEQKELRKRLTELKINMENEHADEDIKRKYFLTMIQLYIYEARDELNSLEFEKSLLGHLAKIKKNEVLKPRKRPGAPLRPVTITSDSIGSCKYDDDHHLLLPSTDVQEIYSERRMKDEIFKNSRKSKYNFSSQESALKSLPPILQEYYIGEDEIDTDDYHILEAMRQKSERKDALLKNDELKLTHKQNIN